MSIEFGDDELSLMTEPVERRVAPRGPVEGLRSTLPGHEVPAEVVEAGTGGIFVATAELERFAVGDTFEVTLACRDLALTCGVRVVRKEDGRRRGIALQVIDMTDEARRIFEDMRG